MQSFFALLVRKLFLLKGTSMIQLEHVTKTFQTANGDVHAVKNVSLHIEEGQIYGIIGFSGAGKSTLVRCMNLLEQPDAGKVIFDGKNLLDLTAAELRVARQDISMIFQHFNLMRSRTIYENVALPLRNQKVDNHTIEQRVMELLQLVDLVERKDAYPSQLSGGQKQRVAIARALATNPKVLLCDEATSALDPQTTQSILQLIKKINKQLKLTVVVITHEMHVVKEICDHVAVMENGQVIEQGDIVSVFSNPQAVMTQNFISTANNSNKIDELIKHKHPLVTLKENQQLVRLRYISENADEALISKVSTACNVECSIIFGNIEVIQDKPIGTIVTKFTGTDEDIKKALTLCKEDGVMVEVMKRGHID